LFYAQRIFFIQYEWSRLAKLAVLGSVLFAVGGLLEPFSISSFLLRSACTLAFLAALFTNHMSRREERQYLYSHVAEWMQRIRGQQERVGASSGGQD
jgi:hypothetical protein